MAEGNQPIAGEATEDPAASIPDAEDQTVAEKFGNDPVGNSLAVVVLIAMIASLVAVPVLMSRGSLLSTPDWLIPVLAVIGIGVSLYLGSVEASGTEAVCGPVGDCNAVQQSEYATIFGIPVGILGIIGYGILLVGWIVAKTAKGRLADFGMIAAALIAFGGTLFSIYLTFLEPFVIGATCMWCLTSAVAITGLLWLTAGHGWAAFGRLRSS